MDDSSKPPKIPEPNDDELIAFMRPETRQTWERSDLTPHQRSQIWKGNKKRWRAAQKAKTEKDNKGQPPVSGTRVPGQLSDRDTDKPKSSPIQALEAEVDRATKVMAEAAQLLRSKNPKPSEKTPSTVNTVWTFIRKFAAFGGAFLLGASWTMLQIDEYGLALLLLLLGLGGLSIQIYDWKGIEGHSRPTSLLKSVAAVLILFSLVYFSAVIIKRKQGKPWSNLLEQSKTAQTEPTKEMKQKSSTSQPAPALTPSPVTSERVPLDIAPEKLLAFFDKYNEAQAEELTQPYIGKWLEMRGRVTEVSRDLAPLRENTRSIQYAIKVVLRTARQGKPKSYVVTQAVFEDQRWMDRAVVLKRNEDIKIVGQIKHVFFYGFYLEHCEIIE